jgi:hypothetical protein
VAFQGNEQGEEHIHMTVASFIFLASKIYLKNKRCFWVRPTLSERKMYSGDGLLVDF